MENNFTIEISEKCNLEKEKFIGGDEHLLSRLDLKLKDEDITKWTDCKKLKPCKIHLTQQKRKNYQA